MRRADDAGISQQPKVLAVEPVHDLAELVVAEKVEERARCGSRVGLLCGSRVGVRGCPCGLLWESIRYC